MSPGVGRMPMLKNAFTEEGSRTRLRASDDRDSGDGGVAGDGAPTDIFIDAGF